MKTRQECSVCGMFHSPGNCGPVEHLTAQVVEMLNRDRALHRRSSYLVELVFAVDDLLANEKSPKYRGEAIRRLRRIRRRFENV